MLRIANLSLLKISIPSILLLFIILYQYLGIPILYFQLDEYRAAEVTNNFLMIKVFLFMVIAITLLIFGFILGRKVFGPIYSFEMKYLEHQKDKILFFLTCLLFFICITVLFSYINKIGLNNLVITSLFGLVSDINDSSNNLLRSNMTNNFDGRYHWYHAFMIETLFFVSMIFVVMRQQKNSLLRNFFLIISLLTLSFALLMSGQKGPITDLIFGVGIALVIIKNRSIISLKIISIIGIILLALIVPLYYLFMDSSDFFTAFTSVFSRTLTGQLQPVYVYLEYFPLHRDFLLGATFPNPGGIFPFEPVVITQEIMEWYNQNQNGVVGSMPTIFWVEAYINFGFLGLIFIPILLGFFLYGINIFILKIQHNPATLGFYIWMIIFYKNLSGTFFSGFIISIYLALVVIALVLLSSIFGFGKFKLHSRNSNL
tara:strand:+ start:7873 stop:9159 length:1287 start_codon:yes stop_codon:yes gene_type:complete